MSPTTLPRAVRVATVTATLAALAAATPAGAQGVPRSRVVAGSAAAPHSAPLERVVAARSSLRHDEFSSNWSGVADTGGSAYTSISATWQVPAVVRAPGSGASNQYSSTWVGIGGYRDSQLIQAGTEQDLTASGTASYSAWYELLPQYSISIAEPVAAGDTVTVAIVETTPATQHWTISVTDTTQDWTFSQVVQYTSSTSAEWIEEAPTVGTSQSTMADYQSVTLSQLSVDGQQLLTPAGSTAHRIDYTDADQVERSYPEGYDAAADSIALTYGTPSALKVAATALADGRLDAAYTGGLVASGGRSPYTWAVTGTLPQGLSLDPATGALVGTPTATGTASFIATVTDDTGTTVSATVQVSVLGTTFALAQGAPTSVSDTAGRGLRSQLALSALQPVALTGAVAYATATTSPWVTVSAAGAVRVLPTAPPGLDVVAGTDGDALGDAGTWRLTVHVAHPVRIVVLTTALPTAMIGVRYSTHLVAFGPKGAPTWRVAAGHRLPKGFALNSAGLLAGTPTRSVAGVHQLHLVVVDGSLTKRVTLVLRVAGGAGSIRSRA